MSIGAEEWPGLAKLAEECGELLQVIGKIIAFPAGEHPDGAGSLLARLTDEMADVSAAVWYAGKANKELDWEAFKDRYALKTTLFERWHEEEQA